MQRRDAHPPQRTTKGPQVLGDCAGFAALARKAEAQEALDRALRQTLPLPLREQLRFAQARNDRLVFIASSSVWAARLRLMQTHVLAMARALGTPASSVIVKVVPLPPPHPEPEPRKPLSAAAAAHLRAAADAVQDSELRELFLRLASFAEPADTSIPQPNDAS